MNIKPLALICAVLLNFNSAIVNIDCTAAAESHTVLGDINNDGIFSVSDVVIFQKWLTGFKDVELNNWQNADLNEDNALDTFDLCLMKRELLKTNDIPTSGSSDYRLETFETYEDYSDFIQQNSLSGKFITYDDFSYIGNFKSAVILSKEPTTDWSKVMYTLYDDSGQEIFLYTYTSKQEETYIMPILSESEINLSDMRKTNSEGLKGTFKYNDREYTYLSGNIYSISWVDNNCEYKICFSSKYGDYPLESNTFISSLLKINDDDPSESHESDDDSSESHEPLMSFDNYGDYKKYIYEHSLDDKIIVYYDLPIIGKFKSCSVFSEDWSDTLYVIDDGTKNNIFLSIVKYDESETDTLSGILESEINLHDKRKTKSTDTNGTFELNNIKYTYINGTLQSISWINNGYNLKLTSKSTFIDYPLETKTFTAKLLSMSNDKT